MIEIFGHILGTLGAAFICIAFYMTVCANYKPTDLLYLVVNLFGAVLLTISLIINFNLGSFMIELFWMSISIKGIWDNHIRK